MREPTHRAELSQSRADQSESIGDTIVQWIHLHAGCIGATHLIAPDIRSQPSVNGDTARHCESVPGRRSSAISGISSCQDLFLDAAGIAPIKELQMAQMVADILVGVLEQIGVR